MIIKKIALALLLLLCTTPAVSAAKTELLVYTAVETELMGPYKKAFETANPDITIKWVRDSAGIITSRLLAEENAPKADVVFGLNVTSMLLLDRKGMLAPYKPKGADNAPAFMCDGREQPTWSGMSACPAAVCINNLELEKHGLPVPQSWGDLTDPRYKGHIIMSNPGSSGTAYSIVSSWLQAFGPVKGWEFMAALDKNIKMYTQSGSHPAEMAARGEIAIGLSEAAFARHLLGRGAPLKVVVLSSPVPLDMEASAIVKGTSKMEAAQKLIDFSVSRDMAKIVGARECVTAQPEDTLPQARSIPDTMGAYDFSVAAEQRQATIDEWRKRFDVR